MASSSTSNTSPHPVHNQSPPFVSLSPSATDSYTQALQAQAALQKQSPGPSGSGLFGGEGQVQKGMYRGSSPLKDGQASVKVEPGTTGIKSSHPPSSFPSVFSRPSPRQDQKPQFFPPSSGTTSRATSVGVPDSVIGSIAGTALSGVVSSRSDPPRRLIEVEMLPLSTAPLGEIKASALRNRLLLQGDPQVINKQRVETAIRVIMDLLRAIPPAPNAPTLSPALFNALPPDNTLTNLSFERINSFRGIRLQFGTTTKAFAKKQLQAGATPENELLYLESAVYMSGENGRRVYACKRCRLREQRRRANKDASRKKGPSSEADATSPMPHANRMGLPPSPDYITGVNPDQYDPHRLDQVVEEPGFDPNRSDWRHEIVLFNSAPEVPVKDGSCVWLPFRVVCYGKCHGEKIGFRIKFTLRTTDGSIIATSSTDPIRITDDHKTDKNAKPKPDPAPTTQAPVPRPRKGRASAASSRRQSPAPSDAESVQSLSEAGAVMLKQTPNVRTKPYERPTTHSPTVSTGGLPFDFNLNGSMPAPPTYRRQLSSGSIQSLTSLPTMPAQDEGISSSFPRTFNSDFTFDPLPVSGTVSPGALRRPNFGMTPLDNLSYPSSAPRSANSSNVASPVNGLRPLSDDMLMNGNSVGSAPTPAVLSAFANLNALNQQQQQQQQNLMLSDYLADQDIASTLNSAMDGLFDASSHASSFADDASAYSGFRDSASGLFSDSGVVPEDNSMEGFLDFSGGTDQQSLSQPAFLGNSPPGGATFPPLFDMDLSNSPFQSHRSPQLGFPTAPIQTDTDAQIRQMLASFQSSASAPLPPPPPQPIVSHVIPSEGPMAGGIQVAVAGQRFAQGMTIVFGNRVAKTMVISDSFCTCELPPAAEAGCVEVGVQGAVKVQGQKVEQFRYLGMDKEMMRLALEVRDQYQGSSSDAAYRLAQKVAQGSQSGGSSDRSSASPMASGISPTLFSASTDPPASGDEPDEDLQLTITNFLAAIDEHAPGSLRRSGAINTPNQAKQTLLHIATVMGYHRLVRRLILMGADVDLQDVNGFTALAFASLGGQMACARALIEAGAAYDRPTAFGEMPLDLAKLGEREDVEALLLSAVWSTSAGPGKSKTKVLEVEEVSEPLLSDVPGTDDPESSETESSGTACPTKPQDIDVNAAIAKEVPVAVTSRIDDDNISSESDIDDDLSKIQPSRRRLSKRSRTRSREITPPPQIKPAQTSPKSLSRRASADAVNRLSTTAVDDTTSSNDDPPPYYPPANTAAIVPAEKSTRPMPPIDKSRSPPRSASPVKSAPPATVPPATMTKTDSLTLRKVLPGPIPALLDHSATSLALGHSDRQNLMDLPILSWELVYRVTSPEELRMFTQAVAVQALNAVVQQAGGIDGLEGIHFGSGQKRIERGQTERRGSQDVGKDEEETKKKSGLVRYDKMLYLFWLPILCFVGFWIFIWALPVITALSVIYSKPIWRTIRYGRARR